MNGYIERRIDMRKLKGLAYGTVGLLALIGLGTLVTANEKDELERHYDDVMNMVNGK